MTYHLQSVPQHDWLGEVPQEWDRKRFKFLFTVSKEKNGSDPVGEMLSVSGYRGIEVKQYEDQSQKRTEEELQDYRVVRPNQLVVNTMWLNYAGLGVSAFTGHVSPAYRSYFIDGSLYPRFVHHLMRSDIYVRGYTKYMQGIRPNSLQIATDDFNSFPVLVPPYDTQVTIADFLDRETAKIDTLIEKQERLIELLEEKRQAEITRAVTKGLNPGVRMKDSGVEWLEEVPEHWEVKRSKFLFEFVTSGSRGWGQYYADDGQLFFRISNLTRNSIEVDTRSLQCVVPPDGAEGERSRIRVGDLLISITADLGSVAVASELFEGGYVSQHVALCRPIKKVGDPRWLGYCFISGQVKQQFLSAGYGGTKIQLSLPDVREIGVPCPPNEERIEIARYIDQRLDELVAVKQKADELIRLLKERRTALISAAVTGKIDVRQAV